MSTPARLRAALGPPMVVLALLVPQAAATATSVIRLDLPQLVAEADFIVEAEATETVTVWVEGELYTLVRLEVDWTLKAASEPPTEVLLPGGVDLHREVPVASIWPGGPQILPGEEVLLFLQEPSGGVSFHTLVGFSQGKMTIHRQAAGAATVRWDTRGLERIGPDGEAGPGELLERPLAELEGEILRLLAARNGIPDAEKATGAGR